MDKETIKEKIERNKIKAEILLKENKKAFVKDIYGTYYFCNILSDGITENKLIVKCFAPEDKSNRIYEIYWIDMLDIKEYQERK